MQDEVVEGFSLSPQQARIWALQHSGDGPACRVRALIAVEGFLRSDRLQEAWRTVIAEYEILRTTFRSLPGTGLPLQVTADPYVPAIAELDPSDATAEALNIAPQPGGLPADPPAGGLDRGPLVELSHARGSRHSHLLRVDASALCLDGPSVALLAQALGQAYDGSSDAAEPSGRPPHYADVAEWLNQRGAAADEEAERGRSYWRGVVEGVAPVRLPWERRTPAGGFTPTWFGSSLSAALLERIERSSKASGVASGSFLLACWQALLARVTGAPTLLIGVVRDPRAHHELRGCLGPLTQVLPMRCNVGLQRPLVDLQSESSRMLRGTDLPPDWYASVEEGRVPFGFEYQTRPTWSSGGLVFSVRHAVASASRFRVNLACAEGRGRPAAELWYDAALLGADDMRCLADGFEAVVEHALEAPGAALGDLPLVTPAAARRVLQGGQGARLERAENASALRLVEAQAARDPERTAVLCGSQRLTYGELDQGAERLARSLRDAGVTRDSIVAVGLPRSPWSAMAVLGVMKSGGAWLPLDPAYPGHRLAFMLRDAKATLLLTHPSISLDLPQPSIPVLSVEDGVRGDPPESGRRRLSAEPGDLAYVIYTSGSAGQPKGVMVTHGSVAGYVQSLQERLGLSAEDVYLHTASFAFSSSVRQLLAPLAVGACVVVATTDEIREPIALFETVARSGVTIVDLVPSYFRACLTTLEAMPMQARTRLLQNRLRLVLTASEPLLSDEARRWSRGLRQPAALVNMFGQTETTGIVATHAVHSPDDEQPGIVPVGRPLANMRIYNLDPGGRPVPAGVVGELYVGGPGLARGYLGRPGLTAERFLPDPYSEEPGGRLYRTGDLGRIGHDGTIEFVGRLDHQLKVRGVRVEPGEIEQVLRRHPAVGTAAVVARGDAPREPRLVAYLVLTGDAPEPGELQRFARARLPEYMVPSGFVFVDALPLTPTGKLDRRSLQQRELAPGRPMHGMVAPRTPTEEALALIWTEVLGLACVGVHDDFFELGGNSLLATQLIARVRRALEVDLAVDAVFDLPTIADLAGAVDQMRQLVGELEQLSADDIQRLLARAGPETPT